MGVWAIIAAAGAGARMGGGVSKLLLPLEGVPVIARTLMAFERCPDVDGVCVACAPGQDGLMRALAEAYGASKATLFTCGGATRQDSVRGALLALPQDTSVVLIHDGARPLVTPALISACAACAAARRACIAAAPVVDTLKRAEDGTVRATVEREGLWAAQTPQAFDYRLILSAHMAALRDGFAATDDAALAERAGTSVHIVPSGPYNLKLTTPGDVALASALVAASSTARVGQGWDAHRLVPGRPLVLGGVSIPHEAGLLGHSDADVAIHALMDALLGAAALGDIGMAFPDSDPAYKGISSLELLRRVAAMLAGAGFAPVSADVTVIAQRPRLSPYRQQMQAAAADALGLPAGCVSFKFSTSEGMGFEGRGEGISAMACAMVRSCR